MTDIHNYISTLDDDVQAKLVADIIATLPLGTQWEIALATMERIKRTREDKCN
tara:strand:- start:2947 stop:3105 length:159 start_codon:yes stop_codon:yes gene_type:complete